MALKVRELNQTNLETFDAKLVISKTTGDQSIVEDTGDRYFVCYVQRTDNSWSDLARMKTSEEWQKVAVTKIPFPPCILWSSLVETTGAQR